MTATQICFLFWLYTPAVFEVTHSLAHLVLRGKSDILNNEPPESEVGTRNERRLNVSFLIFKDMVAREKN